jgi:phage terminase small subunit
MEQSISMTPAIELNARQLKFCDEYMVDFVGAHAAKRAGYSAHSAKSMGVDLLAHPGIQARLADLSVRALQEYRVRAKRVMEELYSVATADIGEAYGADGELLPLRSMPKGLRMAVAAVESEQGEDGVAVKRIKLWDKLKAIELFGKHLGLFTDKVEHSGTPPMQTNLFVMGPEHLEKVMKLAQEMGLMGRLMERGEPMKVVEAVVLEPEVKDAKNV